MLFYAKQFFPDLIKMVMVHAQVAGDGGSPKLIMLSLSCTQSYIIIMPVFDTVE